MKKYIMPMCFILLLALSACAPAQQQPQAPVQQPKADATQTVQEPSTETKQEISAEVKEILDKSNTKIRSIYYKYRGPETGSNFHEFYVKGDKIKYKPHLGIKSLDRPESYDAIFIDKTADTAQSYCTAAYCAYKGKKLDLSYANAYLPTVFDWIDGLTKANKVGEEIIDSRSAWKLETNKGILWVDAFYGIPLKVESGGKTYKFEQISVNAVTDADVTPSS